MTSWRVASAFGPLLWISAVAFGQTITEFPLPTAGSTPGRITAGPDENLWFTEHTYNSSTGFPTAAAISRITMTGSIGEFPVPDPFSLPLGIVAGPDGNIWFTQVDPEFFHNSYISRITPAGSITQFPLPHTWNDPDDITVGSDGNLWFTGSVISPYNHIGRITTAGVFTEFRIPTPSVPIGIAAGPDGNLWFTGSIFPEGTGKIGRITTAGVITEFSIQTPMSGPGMITAGPDGNLWFTEQSGNKIGRITPSGVITEFSIPTPDSQPSGITSGPDGSLWFTENAGNKIGRITTAGVITEFPIPTPSSGPLGITTGPDGNLWFTENSANKIGRLIVSPLETRILPVVGSTAGVGASFFKTSVQLHNPTGSGVSGRIVFHPSGVSGSNSDPAQSYTLSPGQTQSIADLLPAMGLSGLGSADIEATSGYFPAATVRVFNDAGAAGTTGFTEEPLRAEEALRLGQSGVSSLPPGGSISVAVVSGSAIFYGATVDNTTGDPSLQIARPTS